MNDWIPHNADWTLILMGASVLLYIWVEFIRPRIRAKAEQKAAIATEKAIEATNPQTPAVSIAPFEDLSFGIYPAQDELAKVFKPGLLRYGMLVRNGSKTQEIVKYWVENENGDELYSFPQNPRMIPKRLLPDERYIFQYISRISTNTQLEPKMVRACLQLDGPNGRVVKSSFLAKPEMPK